LISVFLTNIFIYDILLSGASLSDYCIPETYQAINFPKRTHAVGRLKEAIVK